MRTVGIPLMLVLCNPALFIIVEAQPPTSGDWIVTDEQTIIDEILELNGDLIVRDGGSLELDGVDLIAGQGSMIFVERGGMLLIEGTVIGPIDSSAGFRIEVRGELSARNSTIKGTEGNPSGSPGLVVKGGRLELQGCEVIGSEGTAISFEGGEAEITDTSITKGTGSGLELADSAKVKFARCEITNNKGWGIASVDSEIEMIGSSIEGNALGGLELGSGSVFAADTTIAKNSGNGIDASGRSTEIALKDCSIWGNSGWGVWSALSQVRIENVDWSGHAPNSLGGLVDQGAVLVKVSFLRSNMSVEGASVRLVPSIGSARTGITDASGFVEFSTVVRTIVDADGEHRRTPYSVKVAVNVRGMNLTGGIAMIGNELWSEGGVPCILTLPDLEIRNERLDASGREVDYRVTLFNNWTGSIPMFQLDLYDGDERLDQAMVGPIPPMTGQEVRFRATLSDRTGYHEVRLVADPSDSIPESDESDNIVERTIEVQGSPLIIWTVPILLAAALLAFLAIGWSSKLKFKPRDKAQIVKSVKDPPSKSLRSRGIRGRSPSRREGSKHR